MSAKRMGLWVVLALLGLGMALEPLASAATRLGLHFTQEELTIWNQRAQNGPYKTLSDASTNSPADWTRIAANAAAVGSSGRWTAGPTILKSGTQCIAQDFGNSPPQSVFDWAHRVRDAAFADRVLGVSTHTATVKTELLWQAQVSWADFANTAHWCTGANALHDIPPSWETAILFTTLLYAYDYVGRAAFTSGELLILDTVFWNAANYLRIDVDADLTAIFPNRLTDSDAGMAACAADNGCSSPSFVTYAGGPVDQWHQSYTNNRRGAMTLYCGLVGIYLTDHGFTVATHRADDGGATLVTLMNSSKLYLKEFIRHTLFPDGSFGEMCRGSLVDTDNGWQYVSLTLGQMIILADTFARIGDFSMYTYNTSAGICASTAGNTTGTINDGGSRVGQNRDLLFGAQAHAKYPSDVYNRYIANIGNADYRIDGRQPRTGATWHIVNETFLAQGNGYWKDAFITSVYTRQHAGTVAYPANPPTGPWQQPWMGENAVYPGVLFMFGQMESLVNPTGPPITPLAPPTNFRVVLP